MISDNQMTRSKAAKCFNFYAQVAKLVDALALGARTVRCGGSSPLLGTMKNDTDYLLLVMQVVNK